MTEQPKLTRDEIQNILNGVRFMDRKFLLLEKGDGFLVQMSYMEPDVDHPENGPMEQKTRKWYISPFMSESEIVETCWACVLRSQQHVASEYFQYKGRRVYSQHFDVNTRIHMCEEFKFDGRMPRVHPDCFASGDSGLCALGTRGCARSHK
jgi:hypothetical protein